MYVIKLKTFGSRPTFSQKEEVKIEHKMTVMSKHKETNQNVIINVMYGVRLFLVALFKLCKLHY